MDPNQEPVQQDPRTVDVESAWSRAFHQLEWPDSISPQRINREAATK